MKSENDLYDLAWNEIETKKYNKACYAKAFSLCEGDEIKTKAKYIELRVTQLADKEKEELKNKNEINKGTNEVNEEKEDNINVSVFKCIFSIAAGGFLGTVVGKIIVYIFSGQA